MALLFEDITAILGQEMVDGRFSRMAALSVFAIHKPRIFEQGLAADGTEIGIYVKNSVNKRGGNRGGEVVILSFTEAMKKDYQPSTQGDVGYGFSSQVELNKSYWNEERYDKDVFALSDEESTLFIDLVGQLMFPE